MQIATALLFYQNRRTNIRDVEDDYNLNEISRFSFTPGVSETFDREMRRDETGREVCESRTSRKRDLEADGGFVRKLPREASFRENPEETTAIFRFSSSRMSRDLNFFSG